MDIAIIEDLDTIMFVCVLEVGFPRIISTIRFNNKVAQTLNPIVNPACEAR